MKKILVTGATGFLGNYVISELIKRKYQVIASSSSFQKAIVSNWFGQVEYLPLNLKEFDSRVNYYDYFQNPDMLIHLAWEGLPNYKASFHIEDNFPRHSIFLKNLIASGLRDVTVAGTCFEYGLQEGCLSEDMPSLPSNPYAIAKDKLRKELVQQQMLIPFVLKWVRLFYTYGKGQSPFSLLSQIEAAIERGDKVFDMSPGDQLRDYLPVEKMAEYIVSIALQTRVTGIINCCSGLPVEVKKIAADYIKEKNADIRLNLGHFPYSDIEPKNFWGNPAKLKMIIRNE